MSPKIFKNCEQLSYWCSWSAQNCVAACDAQRNARRLDFIGDQGALEARSMMNEEILFGEGGFVSLYPEIRSELYFMADDGWDVPYGAGSMKFANRFGSMELDSERFPSFTGNPREKLKAFNERIKACGWKGLGIWIAAQRAAEDYNTPFTVSHENYWKERILWSKYAGVSYWKVDWGIDAHNLEFRQFLNEAAEELYPDLVIEHAACMGPFNGETDSVIDGTHHRFREDKNICTLSENTAAFSKVFRTYDVTQALSTATTLDRVAHLLPFAGAYLNVEDELYMGAALGCQVGIMRCPYHQSLKPTEMHLEEVNAAIRWQKIAPPFIGKETHVSEEILSDSYAYAENEMWFGPINGHTAIQGAHAVVTRNATLPVVMAKEVKPFVVASRHPIGVYSVCILPRMIERKRIYVGGEIVCFMEGNPTDVAVFGRADRIDFHWNMVRIESIRIECLCSGKMWDVTARMQISDNGFSLDGKLIDEIWDAKDLSDPAVRICITYAAI